MAKTKHVSGNPTSPKLYLHFTGSWVSVIIENDRISCWKDRRHSNFGFCFDYRQRQSRTTKCCNKFSYSPAYQGCCNGKRYNSQNYMCCSNTVVRKYSRQFSRCCGTASYHIFGQGFCDTKVYRLGRQKSCRSTTLNNDGDSRQCCGRVVLDGSRRKCYNRKSYNTATEICCGGKIVDKKTKLLQKVRRIFLKGLWASLDL